MKRLKANLYRAGDILGLTPQSAQLCDLAQEDHLKWQTHIPPGEAWSFFARRPGGAEIIACAGLKPYRDRDVLEAWALIGAPTKAEWGALLAMGRAAIGASPARRIQAAAYVDHPHAAETLERLGLSFEGVMRGYGPKGQDAALYARVRS